MITIEQERDNWIECARQHLRNEEYYRDLLVEIGEMFGQLAKTQDDGGIVENVLCAKVPKLVRELIAVIFIEKYRIKKI